MVGDRQVNAKENWPCPLMALTREQPSTHEKSFRANPESEFFPQQRPDNRPRHPTTSQDAFPNRQDVCELIALLCAEKCRHSRFTRWSAANPSATSILLKADRSPLVVKRLCTSAALECTVEVFGRNPLRVGLPWPHRSVEFTPSRECRCAAVLR